MRNGGLQRKLFDTFARAYLASFDWFDALFTDSVVDDDALLVEPNGDWLRVSYE